jgi:hypothetical protein
MNFKREYSLKAIGEATQEAKSSPYVRHAFNNRPPAGYGES